MADVRSCAATCLSNCRLVTQPKPPYAPKLIIFHGPHAVQDPVQHPPNSQPPTPMPKIPLHVPSAASPTQTRTHPYSPLEYGIPGEHRRGHHPPVCKVGRQHLSDYPPGIKMEAWSRSHSPCVTTAYSEAGKEPDWDSEPRRRGASRSFLLRQSSVTSPCGTRPRQPMMQRNLQQLAWHTQEIDTAGTVVEYMHMNETSWQAAQDNMSNIFP